MNKELLKKIIELRDDIKAEIKKYKRLTKAQIAEISLKKNL
jgi:hypothetical protein